VALDGPSSSIETAQAGAIGSDSDFCRPCRRRAGGRRRRIYRCRRRSARGSERPPPGATAARPGWLYVSDFNPDRLAAQLSYGLREGALYWRHLTDARIQIETMIAGLAAQRITAAQLDPLRAHLVAEPDRPGHRPGGVQRGVPVPPAGRAPAGHDPLR